MGELRALSVRQPWAWAIAYGGKRVENRPQKRNYRGVIAIHSGIELDEPGFFPRGDAGHAAAVEFQAIGGRSNLWDARMLWIGGTRHPGLALGAVIAVAEIAGCHFCAECRSAGTFNDALTLCSPWAAEGRWHITLANVRPLAEAVPCRGKLGLWRLPEDTERAVREQVNG
jgi:hypothetical protein